MAIKQKLSPWARREYLKGKDDGLVEGEREGEKKGKKEGIQIGKMQSILSIIKHRFGDFPESLEIRLRQIDDIEVLENLFEASLTSVSFEEFNQNLVS